MPRYFFNVLNHIKTRDFDGVVLSDLKSARREAEKDIAEIKESNFSSLKGDWAKWSIEICDNDGAVLLVVPFSRN